MKCSFIVSAFDRPGHLRCLLASLAIQDEPDFEAIVTDNSSDARNATVVNGILDPRFHHVHTGMRNCYESANTGALLAQGEYLCFPSDDNYYVPLFLGLMLKQKTDLIYCDMIYDPRMSKKGKYEAIEVHPEVRKIDKSGFLVRRSKFRPFPWEHSVQIADGLLIEELIKDGLSHAKAPGVLWVHN